MKTVETRIVLGPLALLFLLAFFVFVQVDRWRQWQADEAEWRLFIEKVKREGGIRHFPACTMEYSRKEHDFVCVKP